MKSATKTLSSKVKQYEIKIATGDHIVCQRKLINQKVESQLIDMTYGKHFDPRTKLSLKHFL